jgi:hypothetical protein
VAKDIEAMGSVCEDVSREASEFCAAQAKAATELGSVCQAGVLTIDRLEEAVQEMTAAVSGSSEKASKQIGDVGAEVAQFHDLAEKQARSWAETGHTLEQTVQRVASAHATCP